MIRLLFLYIFLLKCYGKVFFYISLVHRVSFYFQNSPQNFLPYCTIFGTDKSSGREISTYTFKIHVFVYCISAVNVRYYLLTFIHFLRNITVQHLAPISRTECYVVFCIVYTMQAYSKGECFLPFHISGIDNLPTGGSRTRSESGLEMVNSQNLKIPKLFHL